MLGTLEGERLGLATWVDDRGAVIPFFSSTDAVSRSLDADERIDPATVEVGARELFTMVRGSRLLLDPHGPVPRMFEAAEVEALLAGIDTRAGYAVDYEGQELVIEALSPEPELEAALVGYIAGRTGVSAAHLAWARRGQEPPGYLLFLIAADPEEALRGFGEVPLGGLLRGATLDVTVIPPGVEDHLLTAVPPFYAVL
ncbi:MAG: hypothetical protein JWL64_1053 [Frankiales bacterium]|nr:hypothetical protein [Frankiales bacterium]